MHSKWKVWDYFKSQGTILSSEDKGIYGFLVFESLVVKILRTKMNLKNAMGEIRILNGSELTANYLEEQLGSLSLFGDSEPTIIINAENINKECEKYIAGNFPLFNDKLFVLFFEKDCSLSKVMAKDESVNLTQIEAPFFWEFNKLLDFLLDIKRMNFSYESKQYFLEVVPQTLYDFSNSLNILKVQHPGNEVIEVGELRSAFDKVRVDQFKLTAMLSEKKLKNYFRSLIDLSLSFDEYRHIISFSQSHLVKLADPSYIQKKSRPSKYDKEILAYSKNWESSEIAKFIETLMKLETLSKRKDEKLHLDLKSLYLNQLYPSSSFA
jgi:DNA polymerase III delta subunit